jgi:hypothetical protein
LVRKRKEKNSKEYYPKERALNKDEIKLFGNTQKKRRKRHENVKER